MAELAGRAFTKKGDMGLIGDSLYSTYTLPNEWLKEKISLIYNLSLSQSRQNDLESAIKSLDQIHTFNLTKEIKQSTILRKIDQLRKKLQNCMTNKIDFVPRVEKTSNRTKIFTPPILPGHFGCYQIHEYSIEQDTQLKDLLLKRIRP
ncbi:MAG: hypothetical protein HN589_06415 [Proteobacteria bacterium]|nr:hypothetical protein [Pseudomonadota bacterium]